MLVVYEKEGNIWYKKYPLAKLKNEVGKVLLKAA